ncbi:MAG TPA: hypothetical protein VIF15_22445, partial [Polyangiaceae bacterium]
MERWVAGAVSAGVVGRMRKLAIGYDQEPVEVPNHEVADVPKLLAERFAALQGNADLRASGTEPDTWELSLSVMPSPPNQSFIGDAMLRFARVPDEGPDFSNGLWSAFRSVHSAAD